MYSDPDLVVLRVLSLEVGPRRRHFGDPRLVPQAGDGVGQRLERRPFVADDAQIDRQIAADVLGRRIDADVFRVGTERELALRRHAVLPDQQHEIGAGQRARRRVGRQLVIGGELTLGRARFDDRNLRPLSQTP